MLHFPECVKKAQAEIDQVVEDGRMPNFDDQSSLPYLMAFIKETMRYVLLKGTSKIISLTCCFQMETGHSYWYFALFDSRIHVQGLCDPQRYLYLCECSVSTSRVSNVSVHLLMSSDREIVKDPSIFPEGDKFIPERFLETSDSRLLNYKFGCFGFGRRMCPGMHVALQSMYIVIARWVHFILMTNKHAKQITQNAMGLRSEPHNRQRQAIHPS